MALNNSVNHQVTQYNTLTGAASNLINNVSPGQAGWVLTSNGLSAQPSYQPVPNGGGGVPIYTFISSLDFTNTTTMDFINIDNTYSQLRFILGNGGMGLASGSTLQMRVSTDNGATFIASGYQCQGSEVLSTSGTPTPSTWIKADFDNSSTGINLFLASGANLYQGIIDVFSPATADNLVTFEYDIYNQGGGTSKNGRLAGLGYYSVPADVNAIRFVAGANFTSGTIYMYGVS
ncbi:MAG: hypothetical protein C5B43_01245 [Verrucomicrobia bacterium]|nr:MAG: hypothetical protein C5B43_01245 [Verrucomicrobiota bacterium]